MRSTEAVIRCRPGTAVSRIAWSAGRPPNSTSAEDGARFDRSTPSESEAEAWLSRSTRSTRSPWAASAAERLTAVVVLPTPPLRLINAVIIRCRGIYNILGLAGGRGRKPTDTGPREKKRNAEGGGFPSLLGLFFSFFSRFFAFSP